MKHSNSTKVKELKIGILLDSPQIPFWIYKTIAKINSISSVKIVALIYKKTKTLINQVICREFSNFSAFSICFIFKVRKTIISPPAIDAFKILSIDDLNLNTNNLSVECIEKKYSDFITKDSINDLMDLEPDLNKIWV